MAEPRPDEVPRRDDAVEDSRNPPNSMLHPRTRRATVWSYFVPIVVLFAVIGAGLLYWANHTPHPEKHSINREAVGTIGSREGGFDPAPTPGDTHAEIERRGDDLAPVTSVGDLSSVDVRTMIGRRVAIDRATVDGAADGTLWIRDGDARYAVVGAEGAANFAKGTKVSVKGYVESDEQGGLLIRADTVTPAR